MSPCPGRGRSGAPGQWPQPTDMRHARPPSLMLSSANAGGCQSPGPPERSSAGPSPCRDLLRLWDDLRIRLQSLFKNPNNYRMEIGNCQRVSVPIALPGVALIDSAHGYKQLFGPCRRSDRSTPESRPSSAEVPCAPHFVCLTLRCGPLGRCPRSSGFDPVCVKTIFWRPRRNIDS